VFSGPYLWTTITIMSGTVIGSMDSYIVNTSMPRVLGDLGEPQFYAWVASAFILAQVVGLSVAGAWRDRAGLKTPFLLAVLAFGVGSLLCAIAPSMPGLVLARAFQGLAGGGLNALGFAAAAAYPEAVRLRMLSLISGFWGVVALGAPLLGGLITDSAAPKSQPA
jgi:MFS family permease